MDWEAIGVIVVVVIALIGGGLWGGKMQAKLTMICTTVTNHLTHDAAEVKEAISEIKEDVAEMKTDIKWLKDK